MFKWILALCVIATCASVDGSRNVLSRRKRYAAFPEGASIAFALDMTHGLLSADHIWTEGISWGLSYGLPNSTYYTTLGRRYLLHRRQRRDLYNRMEIVMDSLGFSGRDCIYRALCETAQRYFPNGSSVVEELIRIVFKFPQEKVLDSEPEEHHLYHYAYKSGIDSENRECSEIFTDCPFSMLDLILGGYTDDVVS